MNHEKEPEKFKTIGDLKATYGDRVEVSFSNVLFVKQK